MAVVASLDRKPVSKSRLSLTTGLMLIAVGTLLELSIVPVSNVLTRAGAYRAELARRQAIWTERASEARRAQKLSTSIDQTWIAYDLTMFRVVRAYDTANPASASSIAAFRNLLLAQLNNERPARTLRNVDGPDARDARFRRSRAMFFAVYDDFHTRMSMLCTLLAARLAAPDRALAATDSEVRAVRDLGAEEAALRERWSAVSIAARVASDDAQHARELARQRLDEERAKNVVERLLDP